MGVNVTDGDFRNAIALVDAGDLAGLKAWLSDHPRLLLENVPLADNSSGDYFKNPKLLWFVAENPVRNDTLPANIAAVTDLIIECAKAHNAPNLASDLNYTLALVSSGRVARESGTQNALIETLTRAGADPDGAVTAALAHGETAAVESLLRNGAKMTVGLASGLGRVSDLERLAEGASADTLQEALALAAVNGEAQAAQVLVDQGANADAFNPATLHPHSTPLHQAIASGSLATVKVLVAAGASLATPDKTFDGDALGWAENFEHTEIIAYLRSQS